MNFVVRQTWFRHLLALTFIICGPVLVASTVFAPTPAYALQDGDGGGETETTEDTKPDTTSDDSSDSDDDTVAKKNFLVWMIEASGIFGVILLVLSCFMVAIIMMNVMQIRRDSLIPASFVEDFEQRLNGKDYQGAYEAARADDSLVARVLAAGLGKLNRGYAEAVEGMQEVGEEENMNMEHKLSYLALIASIAPMIGLMGTVYGMINSFREIASASVAPKPKDLAEGISTALFTTLEGLTVAIPAMIAYSILRNRVSRYMLEVGMVSEGLMSRFSSMGKGAAPAPAAVKPAEPQAAEE